MPYLLWVLCGACFQLRTVSSAVSLTWRIGQTETDLWPRLLLSWLSVHSVCPCDNAAPWAIQTPHQTPQSSPAWLKNDLICIFQYTCIGISFLFQEHFGFNCNHYFYRIEHNYICTKKYKKVLWIQLVLQLPADYLDPMTLPPSTSLWWQHWLIRPHSNVWSRFFVLGGTFPLKL